MPEQRAYADIMGNFRRGMGRSRAGAGDFEGAMRVDPDNADSYAPLADRARRMQEQEMLRGAGQSYAQALAAGNYEDAATVAGKIGDAEGVTGAREAQQEVSEQQRMELYRGVRQGLAELEAIEQNGGEGYAEFIARGRTALEQNPDMDPALRSLIESAPEQWNPRFAGAFRTYATRLRDSLLTPQQQADMDIRREERDQEGWALDAYGRTYRNRGGIIERRDENGNIVQDNSPVPVPRDRIEATASAAGGNGSSQEFSRANSLRDEYNTQTAGYRTIADFAARSEAYLQRANAGQPSGQGDVGLVYALAKIYDPTSVVREGEFAMVARQGGYGEQMRSWVETAMGRGFSTAIRNQIMTEIRNGVRAAQGQRDQTRARYTELAQRAGIDPALVIDDYAAADVPADAGGAGGGTNTLPPVAERQVGQIYTMPDGRRGRWNGQGRGFTPVEE